MIAVPRFGFERLLRDRLCLRRPDAGDGSLWFVGLMLLANIVQPAVAEDWPTYRHDNDRSGSTSEPFPGSQLQWRFVSDHAPQRAWSGPEGRTIEGKVLKDRVKFDDAFQPVVSGSRVYFGSSSDHQLYCLDLKTGGIEWTFFSNGPIRLAPTIYKDRVYFGSDDGWVYCLDSKTGVARWSHRSGPGEEWLLGRGQMISRWPVRTGVTVEGGIAYFGAGIFPHEDVFVTALDALTGKPVWLRDNISESDAGRDDLSPQGYLLANDGFLFVPSGRSMPATFERASGKLLHKKTYSWRSSAGGVVGGTRGLLADGQLYSGGAHHLLAIDQRSGDLGFGWFDGRQMVVSQESAYTATGTTVARMNRLEYAVNSRKRHELEMKVYNLSRSLRSASGAEADKIRGQISSAQANLKEIESVGILWQQDSEDDSALLVADHTVLLGGQNRVTAYEVETGEKLSTIAVSGEVRGLVVANGHLLVSTTSGEISCFADSKPEGAVKASAPTNPYEGTDVAEVCSKAAEQILQQTGFDQGYCLVLGSEEGQLAYELAKRTHMHIYAVEPDAAKVARSRKKLAQARMYGGQVTVHQFDLNEIPYSNYFANLIVSETYLRTGQLAVNSEKVLRHLKPLGGVALLGGRELARQSARKWFDSSGLAGQAQEISSPGWLGIVRGALPGAGAWTHQYGNVGNTAVVNDTRVKGDLGVLWFGDPGPETMQNRHDGAVGPLSVNGRLFVQGEDSIMAYDAYNGLFLWKQDNPDAIRAGVFQNQNPGNMAARSDRLFHFLGERCFELDAATGKVVATHRLPPQYDDGTRQWGYIALDDGLLFGTASVRKEIEARRRRRGRQTEDATDAVFAIDTSTGKHLWSYQGRSISHHTIAIGEGKFFFIDSTISSEERARVLREDKSELEALTGEERKIAEDRLKKLDARTTIALNSRTGEQLWAKGVDVTDCSDIGIGGGKLTMMYQGGVLLLCGANANGHYWQQFIKGEFERRRLVALSADAGYEIWKEDANYRHRPIIVGNRVIAEPWAFYLSTGEQITQNHPLTGAEVPWSMIRPGHHCGMLTGCDNMLLFRSGYTGFYNLENDEGTRHFAGHRLGCWINAIPANGLVMIPEASAGCVCQFSIASTIVLEPREARRPWTIVSATGTKTPVQKVAVNFGAPGDRRDANGTIWLAYPRPNPKKVTSLDLTLDLKHKFNAGGFTSVSAASLPVSGTETPWVYTSWASGLAELSFPLRGELDGGAKYDLTLHFAQIKPGTAKFDIAVNGQVMLTDLQVSRSDGEDPKAIVQTLKGIEIERDLVLTLIAKPNGSATGRPVLNALEIQVRQDATLE